MSQTTNLSSKLPKVCPECGSLVRLYRTPRGLRCESCVRRMDSSGLGFR
jgi:hypothetical protein